MQKSITLLSIVLGMFLVVPALALAEESGTGATSEPTTVSAPAPTPVSGGASDPTEINPQNTLPPKPMLIRESPTKQTLPPPKPMLLRESPTKASEGVQAPRDAASGQSTGRRQYEPIIIRKEIDKSTPKLMERGMASGTRPMPAEMENRRGASSTMREKMDERKDELKQKMQERRGEILKRMANQMIERMQAAIDRLVKLADRIDSRVAKLKEKGVDTSATESHLAIARTKIGEAKTAIDGAKTAVASAVANADASETSTTPTDAGKPVRDALNKAKEAVMAAHKALVDAISSLNASAKPRGTASSTAQ